MARTVIDIDEGALKRAARELGTKTKVETVNRALQEIGSRDAFKSLLEHLADSDLGNEEVMRNAWR